MHCLTGLLKGPFIPANPDPVAPTGNRAHPHSTVFHFFEGLEAGPDSPAFILFRQQLRIRVYLCLSMILA